MEASACRKGTLRGAYYTTGDWPDDAPSRSAGYEAAAKQVAANQVMLAGYRLTDVLNDALGPPCKGFIPVARQPVKT